VHETDVEPGSQQVTEWASAMVDRMAVLPELLTVYGKPVYVAFDVDQLKPDATACCRRWSIDGLTSPNGWTGTLKTGAIPLP